MTWTDYKSYVFAIILTLVFVSMFYGLAVIDEKITGISVAEKEKKGEGSDAEESDESDDE